GHHLDGHHNSTSWLGFVATSVRSNPKSFGMQLQNFLEPRPLYDKSPWSAFGSKYSVHLVLSPAIVTFHLGTWNVPHLVQTARQHGYSRTVKISRQDLRRLAKIECEIHQ